MLIINIMIIFYEWYIEIYIKSKFEIMSLKTRVPYRIESAQRERMNGGCNARGCGAER